MMDGSGGIFDSAREEVERMDDAIPFGDCWLGEVLVYEFDGVREQESLGGSFNNVEAAVVFYCWSYVEPFAAMEVPRFSDVRLGVNYDGVSNWS